MNGAFENKSEEADTVRPTFSNAPQSNFHLGSAGRVLHLLQRSRHHSIAIGIPFQQTPNENISSTLD